MDRRLQKLLKALVGQGPRHRLVLQVVDLRRTLEPTH